MKLAHEPAAVPEPLASRPSQPRWPCLYFVLAGFDLLTVCIALYLTHQIMGIYVRSVEVNQVWAERGFAYSRLGEVAAAVNAPGNDVFDSLDVEAEAKKMEVALKVFEQELANRRRELQTSLKPVEAAPILARLDWVSAAMDVMTGEARLIFSYFRTNQPDQAGKRMARMDRTFAAVNAALTDLHHAVATVQQKNFKEQTAAAAGVQTYVSVIAALILVMVAGATYYGYRLARQFQLDAAERERHLQEIREAHALVKERSLQLEHSNEQLQAEIKQRLMALNALHETHRRLQELFKHTLEAQEAQSRHIAYELHDEVAQMLAALKLHLASLHVTRGAATGVEPRVADAGTIVDGAVARLQDLARDLAPYGMQFIGLAGFLASRLGEWTRGAGLHVHFSRELADIRPAFEIETAAYRVVQEAVANVVRHAHARNLWVQLLQADDGLHVYVRDDGIGFEVETTRRDSASGGGLGITLMAQRTALWGGKLEVVSAPAHGTQVHALFPVSPGNEQRSAPSTLESP